MRKSNSVAMRLINIVEAGIVSGTVTSSADGGPIGEAAVTAYRGDEEVTSTATDADGTYALVGLPGGTYRIAFSANGFEDAEVADVAVNAGETTENVNVAMAPAAP